MHNGRSALVASLVSYVGLKRLNDRPPSNGGPVAISSGMDFPRSPLGLAFEYNKAVTETSSPALNARLCQCTPFASVNC